MMCRGSQTRDCVESARLLPLCRQCLCPRFDAEGRMFRVTLLASVAGRLKDGRPPRR